MSEVVLATPTIDTWARISSLCAPMALDDFVTMLILNGFSEVGYLQANSDLSQYSKTSSNLLVHFCEYGIPELRHFRIVTGQSDLLKRLRSIYEAPIADADYKNALVATFARAWWNETLWHDPQISGGTPRETCDRFSDADIQTMMSCKEFGALPYFTFGDSQIRLYQHILFVSGEKWLLPISFTCSGGSARGLKFADSMFSPDAIHKFGPRIKSFFARIRFFVAQDTKCFFKFGQTDLDYLYFYQWQQEDTVKFDEEKFHAFADESLERYLSFLTNLASPDLRKNIYVCSIMPPALADAHWREFYIEAMLSKQYILPDEIDEARTRLQDMKIPDITTRTALYMDVSRRLERLAKAEGFPFVDDASMFLNEERTKMDEKFIKQSGGKEVHVDRNETTLRLIAPLIDNLLKQSAYG